MEQKRTARADGRGSHDVRPLSIETPYLRYAEGSASIRSGNTWVLCAATVEDRQPAFLKGTQRGWVTAEYGLLPRSVGERAARGRTGGRSAEIQRLIGRSLRTVVDLRGLAEQTITLDCDVIEADGGTRAAAVAGAFVALCQACRWMVAEGRILRPPILDQVAGIGVGIVGGEVLCDLDYAEDCAAEVDLNVFMTGAGRFAGLQGTAEKAAFDDAQLGVMLGSAREGLRHFFAAQRTALGLALDGPFDAPGLGAAIG